MLVFECIYASRIYSATDDVMAIFISLMGAAQDSLSSRYASTTKGVLMDSVMAFLHSLQVSGFGLPVNEDLLLGAAALALKDFPVPGLVLCAGAVALQPQAVEKRTARTMTIFLPRLGWPLCGASLRGRLSYRQARPCGPHSWCCGCP